MRTRALPALARDTPVRQIVARLLTSRLQLKYELTSISELQLLKVTTIDDGQRITADHSNASYTDVSIKLVHRVRDCVSVSPPFAAEQQRYEEGRRNMLLTPTWW